MNLYFIILLSDEYNVLVIIMKQKILFLLSLFMYILILVAVIRIKTFSDDYTISTIDKNSIINFEVTSKSCIVIDASNNNILYEKNAYQMMLPASITKILTAITAIETYPLDDYVYITNDIANQVGSKIYLKDGDLISINNLLYGLILSSGNDCAMAIATHYSGNEMDFISLMNDVAKKTGAKNSIFKNPSGLDEKSENKTTAYDMAVITSYAMKNLTFRTIFGTPKKAFELDDRIIYLHHKHRLIHTNDLITGGKTGYTKRAGRTLVSSFKHDNNEIIVVTIDAYNDWEIHTNFANLYLGKKTIFQMNNSSSVIYHVSNRLRGKKDD